jgi:hypothetical protein
MCAPIDGRSGPVGAHPPVWGALLGRWRAQCGRTKSTMTASRNGLCPGLHTARAMRVDDAEGGGGPRVRSGAISAVGPPLAAQRPIRTGAGDLLARRTPAPAFSTCSAAPSNCRSCHQRANPGTSASRKISWTVLFNSSEKRLARTLLLLARCARREAAPHALPKLSQEGLAETIGTTRSCVSFFMNTFRKLGFIDYDADGVMVHPSLVSVVLHE